MARYQLDNRGLEPPEPMMRVLAKIAELQEGDELEVWNDREPVYLYAKLAERGLQHQTEIQEDGSARILIRR